MLLLLRRGGGWHQPALLQRLPCLVEWATQQQQQQCAAAGQQRHASSSSGDGDGSGKPAFQFSRKRKKYQDELSKLRKQWAEERQRAEAAQAAADEAAR